ncbi:hypothetical protein HSBAA_14740 [Vreelandella sulfidaeris]|uniref:DRTGG domain-containing protein n=1 Tax=Vreelandella sulfidaeris TaxID=115553 RepID=A0A455U7E0_9GAMM|nr:hypothetical protein HSBAA_14740 [Halomonas sulfidaeris]
MLSTSLCARSATNALHIFKPGSLVVASGDRDDVVLASALATMNGTQLAGVLLTNGFIPNENMIEMCRPALKTGLPVLVVETDSLTTAQNLSQLSSEIPMDDFERAEQVARYVAAHMDLDWLKSKLSHGYTRRLSPSAFRYQLVKLAQQVKKACGTARRGRAAHRRGRDYLSAPRHCRLCAAREARRYRERGAQPRADTP